jgi:hypothetical protein
MYVTIDGFLIDGRIWLFYTAHDYILQFTITHQHTHTHAHTIVHSHDFTAVAS